MNIGVQERPTTIYLIEWTDILGKQRQAISTDGASHDIRRIDPDHRVIEGRIEWHSHE